MDNNQVNTRMQDALWSVFKDSEMCCSIAGQAQEISKEAKQQQLKLIQEEVKELKEALDTEDLVEQLDACSDILITVFGYMLKLERQGADLGKALIKTGQNNLTKFPTDRDVVEDTVQFYKNKGIETKISLDLMYNKWVIRDMSGKYRKPKGFIENDLSDCWNY